jgi:hypothetical protein
MSLALASWFLHRLAGEETGWDAPYIPRNRGTPGEEKLVSLLASVRVSDGLEGREGEVRENGRGGKRVGLRRSPRLQAGSKKPPDGET